MLTARSRATPFLLGIITVGITGFLFFSSCKNEKSRQESKNSQTLHKQSDNTAQNAAQKLRDACLKGQAEEVTLMTEQGVDVNASDDRGRTPLMLASFNGHAEVVRVLLDKGARVNDRNTEGRTPLIFAASGPFAETVELLLKQGADPNAVDKVDGWSALMFAAAEGNTEVVQTLLAYDADPSLKDTDDETALDFAENNGHEEVAQLLESSEENN